MDPLSQLNPIFGSTISGGNLAAPVFGAQSPALQRLGGLNNTAPPLESALIQAACMQMLQLMALLMVGQAQATPQLSPPGAAPVGANPGATGGTPAATPAAGKTATPSGTGGAAPAETTSDEGEIKGFIAQAAQAYGADPKVLTEIARRESSFKTGVVNNWDSNAKKGTPSKGLFQFIEPTFKSMAPKAKAANPQAWAGLGELNWLDWRQQALTAAWAIANGQGSHWATYKAAGGR